MMIKYFLRSSGTSASRPSLPDNSSATAHYNSGQETMEPENWWTFKFITRTQVTPASLYDGAEKLFNDADTDSSPPALRTTLGNDDVGERKDEDWLMRGSDHFDDLSRPDRDQAYAAAQGRLANNNTRPLLSRSSFASTEATAAQPHPLCLQQNLNEHGELYDLDPGPEERHRRALGKRPAWQNDELARRRNANKADQDYCAALRSVQQPVYRR
jgi:hypothetical protein